VVFAIVRRFVKHGFPGPAVGVEFVSHAIPILRDPELGAIYRAIGHEIWRALGVLGAKEPMPFKKTSAWQVAVSS